MSKMRNNHVKKENSILPDLLKGWSLSDQVRSCQMVELGMERSNEHSTKEAAEV